MNIVAVNYAPEPAGTAPFTADLTRTLSAQGHHVKVLTSKPHYPNWVLSDRDKRLRWTTESLGNVKITRCPIWIRRPQSLSGRIGLEISFSAAAVPHIFRLVRRGDVTIAVIPSLFSSALTTAIAGRFRHPTIVWMQDSMSLALIETGASSSTLLRKWVRRIEVGTLRRAAHVVVISERFREQVLAMGVRPSAVSVIRNWSFLPRPTATRQESRERLGWSATAFVAVHAGNMGAKQGLTGLIEAARISSLNDDDTLYVLAGGGHQREELQSAARELENVAFLGSLGDQEYANLLAAADVALVCEKPGVAEMSLPSKLASYSSAGRPIIGYVDPGGATAAELARSGSGLVADNRTGAQAIVSAIAELRRNPGLAEALSAAGHRYAATHFEREQGLETLSHLVISQMRKRKSTERSTRRGLRGIHIPRSRESQPLMPKMRHERQKQDRE